ncbi:serine/threonine-protein kinase tousled-like 2 isoform X2 [Hydractinia symbiolongicarpus]|uniref:serine/threonine-protein kinase tousled-like 2 isoform X2 n=1 Tax=Hydractinia symbiolongicarpus TaxID=13093 RepID=UPI00254A8154|nr:serine/threonine-protein kinase tousled-like 2 isoform X2 [Hydractinia symbiolongicarpus]
MNVHSLHYAFSMNYKPESIQKSERTRRTRQQKSRNSPNSKLLNAAWPKAPSVPIRSSQIKVDHDEFKKSWSHWRQHAVVPGGESSIEDMDVDTIPNEDSSQKNTKTSPFKNILPACHSKSMSSIRDKSSDKEKNTLFVKSSFSAEDNRQKLRARRVTDSQTISSSTTQRSTGSENKSDNEEAAVSKDQTNLQKSSSNTKQNKENKALFIIIHVNKVEIGNVCGPATSPVRVYADKFMVQMENENLKKDVSFRVPCKRITSLQISLKEKPFIIKFESTEIQYIKGGNSARKSKGGQEPESITLHLAYEESVPLDVQDDLKELFQVRLSEQNLWVSEKEKSGPSNSDESKKREKSVNTNAKQSEKLKAEEDDKSSKEYVLKKNISATHASVRKRTPKVDQEKEEAINSNNCKFPRRTNQELHDALEEQVKTLTHEAAHYQMLSAQQRMIIQSLEEDVRQKTRQSEGVAAERSREKEGATKLLQDKDVEKEQVLAQLEIERELISNLENQLEAAQNELREKSRQLQEREDSLKVRDETIQQLRSTMRRHSLDDKTKEPSVPTVPLSVMEETRHHLMQMQVSKEHLTVELQQIRQDLSRKCSEVDNLRLQLRESQREIRMKTESLTRLRTDFITSQEDLVTKSEQVRSLNAQLVETRGRSEQESEQSRELASTKAELDLVKLELTEVRTRLNENREIMNERQNALRDWILGRGEISLTERIIGVGAWGNVKVGKFRGTEVAVKQIHLLILSSHNRRLFEREMAIASRCRHPCLVQFIGATNDDGTPLFVMELLEIDLRSLLSRESLTNHDCLQLGFDTIRALNYLHQSKPVPIIHRDLSSSNILLYCGKTGWRGKLSDYGAANFMRLSMTRHPGATLYSAPEASTNDQTTKLDVYSFGVLFCEMCTRELPVPENRQEQVDMVTNTEYKNLIKNCLRRSIENRLNSQEVLLVFEQWMSRLDSSRKADK